MWGGGMSVAPRFLSYADWNGRTSSRKKVPEKQYFHFSFL